MSLKLKNSLPLTVSGLNSPDLLVTYIDGGRYAGKAPSISITVEYKITYVDTFPKCDDCDFYILKGFEELWRGYLAHKSEEHHTIEVPAHTANFTAYWKPWVSYSLTKGETRFTAVEAQGSWENVRATGLELDQYNILKPIKVCWNSENQNLLEIKLKQGEVVKYTEIGTTEQSVIIPAGVLNDGNVTVLLEVGNGTGVGGYGVTTTVSETFGLIDPRPVVTNLVPHDEQQSGKGTIYVTWSSNYQTSYNLKVFWNSRLVQVFTGGAETSVNLPAKFLYDGSVRLELAVSYILGAETFTRTAIAAFTVIENPVIDVKSLAPVTSQDGKSEIPITWESENQKTFTLKVFWGSILANTYSGTTDTEIRVPAGFLFDGTINLELTVYNVVYGKAYAAAINRAFSIFNNAALSIRSLEPNAVPQNADYTIDLTWVSVGQERYTLDVHNNGALNGSFLGTDAMFVRLPARFCASGSVSHVLTVYRTVYGVQISESKTAVFKTYGKPPAPNLDEKINYTEAKPKFFWSAADQTGYRVQIYTLDNVLLEDSQELDGEIFSYTTTIPLQTGKDYLIKVSVRSIYQLWSDYAQKTIYVSYTQLSPATINTTSNVIDGSILIDISNQPDPLFFRFELLRSEDKKRWKTLMKDRKKDAVYTDAYVGSGVTYYYKVLSYSTDGGITESEIAPAFVQYKSGYLALPDRSKVFEIPYEPELEIEHVEDTAFLQFLGKQAQNVEVGFANYQIVSAKIDMTMQEYENLSRLKDLGTLLYKNPRGLLLFCTLTNLTATYVKNVADWVRVQFRLTEVAYSIDVVVGEVGQRLVPTYADGVWYANGEIEASGWALVEE